MEAKHFYFAVFCKTPECKGLYPLRYLGQQSEANLVMDGGFSLDCEKSHERHIYQRDDIKLLEFSSAPPAGWKARM